MRNFITARYIGYVVGNVKSMEGGYGFRIKLIYKNGETLVEENSGYKSEKEAKWEREVAIKLLKKHQYIIQPDTTAEDYFNAWLGFVSPKLSKAMRQEYQDAVLYINQKYGKVKIRFWDAEHVVSVYKSAWKDSKTNHIIIRNVLKKALKFAKTVGYLSYDLEKDNLIFEEWFISNDMLSGSGEITMTEDGQPVYNLSAISKYIEELGIDGLYGKNKKRQKQK